MCWIYDGAAGWATLRSVGDSDLIYESKIIRNFTFSLLRLPEATCVCGRTQQMLFCVSRVALLHLMKVPDGPFTFRGAQESGRRPRLLMLGSTRNRVQYLAICCAVVSTLKQLLKCQNTFVLFFFAARWKSRRDRGDNKLFVCFFQIRITLRTGAANIAAPHVSMCEVSQLVFDWFALVNYSESGWFVLLLRLKVRLLIAAVLPVRLHILSLEDQWKWVQVCWEENSIHPSSPAASLDGATKGWSLPPPGGGWFTLDTNGRTNMHTPDPQGVRTQNLWTVSPCVCDQTQQMLFCLSRVALLDLMKAPDYIFTLFGSGDPPPLVSATPTVFSGSVPLIRTQSSDRIYVPWLWV